MKIWKVFEQGKDLLDFTSVSTNSLESFGKIKSQEKSHRNKKIPRSWDKIPSLATLFIKHLVSKLEGINVAKCIVTTLSIQSRKDENNFLRTTLKFWITKGWKYLCFWVNPLSSAIIAFNPFEFLPKILDYCWFSHSRIICSLLTYKCSNEDIR